MKKLEVSQAEIDGVKGQLLKSKLSTEQVSLALNTYITSKTTLRRMKMGSVYNKGILNLIKLNNPKSIKRKGNYYILTEYNYNIIRKGLNWWESYVTKLKESDYADIDTSNMTREEILEMLDNFEF